jgi:hypothetical protein
MMIKGFMQLKDVEPGEIVRLKSGTYALITEYVTGTDAVLDSHYNAYISGTGEVLSVLRDEWVAVIDMEALEFNVMDSTGGLEYPTTKQDS